MDDAEGVPIDLGYATAAEASDPRTTARQDGSLVIDILVPQPCVAEPSTEEEIVVCAEAPEGAMPPPVAPPHSPNLNERIAKALHAQVGPLELGSIRNRDGTYSFGARIRF